MARYFLGTRPQAGGFAATHLLANLLPAPFRAARRRAACRGARFVPQRLAPRSARWRILGAGLWLALLAAPPAQAVEREATLPFCYNYGCNARGEARFLPAELDAVRARLAEATTPAEERAKIAEAVGWLYGLAGRQLPLSADRGGNYRDEGVEGRMDCIDHSTNTTTLLELLAARGDLRFHRVLKPARRARFIIQHFSALIEEVPAAPRAVVPGRVADYVPAMLFSCGDCRVSPAEAGLTAADDAAPAVADAPRYVVDSWFVDNGLPAVILPLANWMDGEGPDVE